MSFMEKVGSIMRRPGEDAVPKDEVPWWLKYGGRALGTFGGGMEILLGVWNLFSILFANIACVMGGILQITTGFGVLMIEAPCCCLFIDFVQTVSTVADQRPYWNRAALYVVVAIPPVLLCPEFGTIFGSALIFGTGILYGMMALGKKASVEEMKAAAQNQNSQSQRQKSNLVENAAPMGQSPVVIPPV